MTSPPVRSPAADLAFFVDAYEDALADDPAADLADHLPDRGHPLYLSVLAELARIDLERGWASRRPTWVADLLARFPRLADDASVLAGVAFEEYRQRRLIGDSVTSGEYAARFGIDTADWPAIDADSARSARPAPSTHNTVVTSVKSTPADEPSSPPTARVAVTGHDMDAPPKAAPRADVWEAEWAESDPESVADWDQAKRQLPEPGTEFLGFNLVGDLGKGAFGRVYLARQGELSGRPVALKVAWDIAGESQTLAQLQHTNIVPIYSYHRDGPLQAVCMPFFGATALDRVVKHLAALPALPSSGSELRRVVELHRTGVAGAPPAPGSQPGDGWERIEGLAYPDAALWLAAQLTDGLAHAHRRGILHRDLKPANVLLTDDGRPMLLDFNLAENVNARGKAAVAAIGGTLPYMAPEQLQSFKAGSGRLDERADLYALGVVLFELLTGKHPFPPRKGPVAVLVPAMLADRMQPPPDPRRLNPAVSPAAAAIVRKCLAPNPADRYARAEDLHEDLTRHLSHQPLKHAPEPSARERMRKWARRHPRLSSSATVAAVAAAFLAAAVGGFVTVRERSRGYEARTVFADHRAAFGDAQAHLGDRRSVAAGDEGMAKLRTVLDRYGVSADDPADDAWQSGRLVRYLGDEDRQRLREDVGEAFYLMAKIAFTRAQAAPDQPGHLDAADRWNEAAARLGGDRVGRAVREQRADLISLRGKPAEADRVRDEARAVRAESARDLYLLGYWYAQQGRHREALPLLRTATLKEPENFSAWFVRGTTHLALDQNEMAALCFGSCVALRKDSAPAWLNRGMAYSRMRFFDQACDDYDRAIELKPDYAEAFVQRAAARSAVGDHRAAEADLTHALGTGHAPVRVYFLRASVRAKLKDEDGAKADREAGLALTPADELSWIARSEAQIDSDPTAALVDVGQALRLNPHSLLGLRLKAHLLDKLKRPAEALAALNLAVKYYPDNAPARAGRGVLLARAGEREAALQDARDALLRDTKAPNLYQVAGIYALTSKEHPEDRAEALRLLWSALKTGFGLSLVDTDADLDPIRKHPEFVRIVGAAKATHGRPPRPGANSGPGG